MWLGDSLLFPQEHNAELFFDELEPTVFARCGDMAHVEAAPSHRMFLESAHIRVAHASHALTWPWTGHGAAHQGTRVSLRHPTENAAGVFEILNHPNHTNVES